MSGISQCFEMFGSSRFVTKQADDAVCSLLSVTNTYTFTVLSQCTKHIRDWTSRRSVSLSSSIFTPLFLFCPLRMRKRTEGFTGRLVSARPKHTEAERRPLTLPTMANVTAQAAIHSLTLTHTLPCTHRHTQMESQSPSHTHSHHPSGTQPFSPVDNVTRR